MEQSPDGSVNRRSLLRLGVASIAGAVALAGCTQDVGEEFPANEHWPNADLVPDLPVRERTERVEAGIEELTEADVGDVDDFVSVLEGRGIRFESVEEVVELLHLEYVESDPVGRGILDTVGPVAGAYAALVRGGFEGRGLEMLVLREDGSTIGVVEASTEWAVEYVEGALSAAEYGELVASTIETTRQPPEHDVAPEE